MHKLTYMHVDMHHACTIYYARAKSGLCNKTAGRKTENAHTHAIPSAVPRMLQTTTTTNNALTNVAIPTFMIPFFCVVFVSILLSATTKQTYL